MKKKNILLVMASLLLMLGVCGFIFIKSQKTVEVDMSIVDIIVRNSATAQAESGPYYEGYYNEQMEITVVTTKTSLSAYVPVGGGLVIFGLTHSQTKTTKGILDYCEPSFWWFRKCYLNLNGFTPTSTTST